MAQPHAVEVMLRPAVELYSVGVSVGAAALCLFAPWSLALSPLLGLGAALGFLTFAVIRFHLLVARLELKLQENRSLLRKLPSWLN